MTQTQMHYFNTAYERRNINAAAAELLVSRSVISRAIKELEEEFGAVLFIRSKNGIEPTEAGTAVHTLFTSINYSYQRTVQQLGQLSSEPENPALRIGVSVTNALKVYRTWLSGYVKAHPELRIVIVENPSSVNWECLMKNEVDICFLPGKAEMTKADVFEVMPLFYHRIVLGVSAKNPLAKKELLEISDILDLPLGRLTAPLPRAEIFEACFSAFSKEPNFVVRTSSPELLKEMTTDDLCCALLTNDQMEDWEGVVAVPFRFFEQSTNYMIWNKAIPHGKAFHDFLAYMRAGR